MERVKNKVVFITGGASDIGEATAKLLAKEGAQVAILDIDDENGKRVVAEIEGAQRTACFWHLDISHEKEVEQVFTEIYRRYSLLNILVNNAGITGFRKTTHETTSEEWDSVMNVNLKGTFFCTKYAVPYMMRSGGGSVINVSSIMGILGESTPIVNTFKAGIRHQT
jgi:NAD(P)-dependent dehydrogenase (short-subunit alcohol dehydrogenase family)